MKFLPIVYHFLGYLFVDTTILMVIDWLDKKLHTNVKTYIKWVLIQPILLFVIPITLYYAIPTHSIPFCIFFTGRLMFTFWGVKDFDSINLSEFQRRHGSAINNLSFILSLSGIVWGAYKLITM